MAGPEEAHDLAGTSASQAADHAPIAELERSLASIDLSGADAPTSGVDLAALPDSLVDLVKQVTSAGSVAGQLAAIDSVGKVAARGPLEGAAVAAAGSIPVLVDLAESTSSHAVRAAARAVVNSLAAGIPRLVECLGSANSVEAQCRAARTLGNMAAIDRSYGAAVAAAPGIIPAVAHLLDGSDEALKIEAASCVACMAHNGPPGIADNLVQAGAIPGLLQCLDSGSVYGQRAAATAVEKLGAHSPAVTEALVTAGAIPKLAQVQNQHLVQHLQQPVEQTQAESQQATQQEQTQEQQAAAQQEQQAVHTAVRAVGRALYTLARSIIPELMRRLSSSSPDDQCWAAVVLAELAATGPLTAGPVADTPGSIASLVQLLGSGSSPEMQQAAAGALAHLAALQTTGSTAAAGPGSASAGAQPMGQGNFTVAPAVVEAGAIPALVKLLGSDNGSSSTSPSTPGVQHAAVAALYSLTAACPSTLSAVADENGSLAVLVGILGSSSSTPDATCLAVGALQNLAFRSPQTAAAVIAAGSIPALVPLVQGSCSEELQLAAAGALNYLVRASPASAAAIARQLCATDNDAAVGSGLGELVRSGSAGQKQVAATTLASLAGSNPSAAVAVTSAGGFPALFKLFPSNPRPQVQSATANAMRRMASAATAMRRGRAELLK